MNASSEETKTIADVKAAPQQPEPLPLAADADKAPVVDEVEEEPTNLSEIVIETKAPPLKVEIPSRAQHASEHKDEASDQEEKKEDDGIVRISNKTKNYRAQIGYLMSRLNAGKSVSLQAYGHAVNKAILLSSIVRTKLGDIHQTVTLSELREEKRESAGIKILLSKDAPADLTDIGYQMAEPKGFWQRKERPARKDAPQKKSDNADQKDAEKVEKVVDEEANNKSVARSTRSQGRRSQSSRRARDKQSQTAVDAKPAGDEAKNQSASPRRESRRHKHNSKAKEDQPQPAEAKKQQKPVKKAAEVVAVAEETKKPKGQRNNNRRRERDNVRKDEHSSDQKENIKVQAKSSAEKKTRGAAVGKGDAHESSANNKQKDFQKSWAQDEDVFLYEGGQAKRQTAEQREQRDPKRQTAEQREQRDQPRGRGRGNYQGGMGRRPPQYQTDYYPPMRGPYFPQGQQDYYMMRPPYQQYRSYYNQPGYQKGQGTREIGQKPQPNSSYQQRRGGDSGEHTGASATAGMRRDQAPREGGQSGYYQQQREQRGQNYQQPTSHGGQHESSSHYVL